MALTLPTLTVQDDAKADRLIAAFKPHPDATQQETAQAYRRWLKEALVDEVIRREAASLFRAAGEKRAELSDLMQDI
jgi:hypothetical protein